MIRIGNVPDIGVGARDRDLPAAGEIEMTQAADVAGEASGRSVDRVHAGSLDVRYLMSSPAGLTRGSIALRKKRDMLSSQGDGLPGQARQ